MEYTNDITKKRINGITSNANPGSGFVFQVNGSKMVFRMPNETSNAISADRSRIYEPKADALIRSARTVRGQKLFGNVDPGELSHHYPFRPFDYQIENVKTMLNRFEGRGVFGDQVGLGKTVEALMTAHAMFESGAIRNALIVVPHKTVDGWKSEIESKFPGIFKLFVFDKSSNDKGKTGDTLEATVQKIIEDNRQNKEGNRLYIITDGVIKRNLANIRELLNAQTYNNLMLSDIGGDELSEFEKIEKDLLSLEPSSIRFNPKAILIKNKVLTEDEYGLSVSSDADIPLNIAGLEFIINTLSTLLEKCRKHFERKYDSNENKVIGKVRELIDVFSEDLEYKRALISSPNPITKLFDKNEERHVDLLMVDEVHSFYEQEGEAGYSDSLSMLINSERMKAVDLLAEMNKKFCVLMSATPVRYRLEDVFELVYIADKNLFGSNREDAEDYFYGTVCGVDKNTVNKLSVMIEDPAKRGNFFGLINNFFTRKRINDVSYCMKGRSDKPASQFTVEEDLLFKKHAAQIIENFWLMEKQSGAKGDDLMSDAARFYFERMDKKPSHKMLDCLNSLDANNCRFEDRDKYSSDELGRLMRLNDAIDKVFTSISQDVSIDVKTRRTAHRMVDWRRRDKKGILVSPVSKSDTLSEQIIENTTYAVTEATERFYEKLYDAMDVMNDNEINELLKTVWYTPSAEGKDLAERADIAYANGRRYSTHLANDAMVCYISRLNVDGYNIRQELMSHLSDNYRGTRQVLVDPADPGSITIKNHNRISIVSGSYQAGVNMQQHSVFVFAQMDQRGDRLLEPVDIEQWIGRIHRTGQVKQSYILTVPVTYMQHAQNNPDYDFLFWYYRVLSDKNGLDLFGNHTPDIAFLQPIIVDCFRRYLTDVKYVKKLESKRVRDYLSLPRSSDRGVDKYSFSQLMEFFYTHDKIYGKDVMKKKAEDIIRTLCNTDGFGKK